MRGTSLHSMLLSLLLAFGQGELAWACQESPGPNTADPAPLGGEGKKAKFDKGKDQARVHFELLNEPLAKVAKACGEDLTVYSGFRNCNANAGKAKKSFHLRGQAADLKFCKGKNLAQMFQILAKAGCGGIGCYPNFIQCDTGPKRQWGPCPGNRPPPDNPPKDKKDEQEAPPPQAYDSQTPSEPTSSAGAPAGGSPPAPAPSSITPSYPPGQAQYPQPLTQVSHAGNTLPDMRDRSQKPRNTVVNGIVPPVEDSTVTKKGDAPAAKEGGGGPSEISKGDPAAAFAALAGNGSFGQLSAAKLQNGATGASGTAPFGAGAAGGAGAGTSARGVDSATGGAAGANPYAASGGSGGYGGGGGGGGSRSEALASFNNAPLESKGLGMKGGVVAMDDEIRRIQENDFGGGGDRSPASEGAAEGGTLFSRTHSVHERCQRRGWLTRGGS